MNKEPCFHCDIKNLISSKADEYTTLQVGEGLILSAAEFTVLNTNYRTDVECKAFAMMEFMRALEVALQMKNSGEKIVAVESKEFLQ